MYMKKIIFGLVAGLAVLSVSCDYQDPNGDKFNDNPESGFVRFATPNAVSTQVVGCSTIEVPFVLEAPVNEDGVEVFYTITDISGSSAGLETYATVPAGSREGVFVVTNSEVLTSPVEFKVTLTGTNKDNVVVLADAGDKAVVTVKIVPELSSFVNTYSVQETSFEGTYNYTSVVTAGAAANELVIGNIYGLNSGAQTTVTVNADGTLSFEDFTQNPVGDGKFLEGLSGTADACAKRIVISFNLRSGAGGTTVAGPYQVVLTRS
jgi:hypothetical protein